MVAVFCRDCRKKLYNLYDINVDRLSLCPNCGSIYKFYRTTYKQAGDSVDTSAHTAAFVHNKYSNVNIFISDIPDGSKLI